MRWADEIKLLIMDEGHHLLRNNMWGRGVSLFKNARGLGVSAWFGRTDGKGLGSHADGFYDELVRGPSPQDLITQGHLSNFLLYGPNSDIDLTDLDVTASGDFSNKKLVQRVRKSKIVGDVVKHYLKLAPGKLGVTFVTDTETARETADKFIANGIPAVAIDANTPTAERSQHLKDFANRNILQIVNVDIFGEGFDCPAIEVVSFARPTASYSLFIQQFGRALRILPGKEFAIIIDHVGNINRFGGPPLIMKPSGLDAREKRSKKLKDPDDIPRKTCKRCLGLYEAFHAKCPLPLPTGEICGYAYIPEERSKPEFVEGDLSLLDCSYTDEIREKILEADRTPQEVFEYYRDVMFLPTSHAGMQAKNHIRKQATLFELREKMAWWSGHKIQTIPNIHERQRLFFHSFGYDVLTAQSLKRQEMLDLIEVIKRCKI